VPSLVIRAATLSAIGIITIAAAVLLIHIPRKPITAMNPAMRLGTLHAM